VIGRAARDRLKKRGRGSADLVHLVCSRRLAPLVAVALSLEDEDLGVVSRRSIAADGIRSSGKRLYHSRSARFDVRIIAPRS
jgi:hypothetical protein